MFCVRPLHQDVHGRHLHFKACLIICCTTIPHHQIQKLVYIDQPVTYNHKDSRAGQFTNPSRSPLVLLNSMTARDTAMTKHMTIRSPIRDLRLANGRWACPRCTQDFVTRKVARQHVRRIHDRPRWPCESKHMQFPNPPSEGLRRSDDQRKVFRVESKPKPWRCTNSCGKGFTRRSGLSRHLREVCMKNGGSPVPPEATSAVQKPVVSMRLQMKRLLSKKQHDYLDNVGISRSNIGPSSEKYMRRDVKSSIPSLPESPIFPKRSDQGTSADKTAISSIIVARDKSTSDIKRILLSCLKTPTTLDNPNTFNFIHQQETPEAEFAV